ncbi:hypothetical protein ER308_00245 [Egibacter rhizosphaerae]|uniref:Uncharacterized protein n=1 Tax=Egibacter rhizosphaerae TaxID=1670831 RepID=A0A411YAC3_9ACTN|nr:hypothetical protein [Egibacter rhizosphaerae]QBI18154.1 hypothetical protein ER308_00245 [Egibacter rhizosphaerae]
MDSTTRLGSLAVQLNVEAEGLRRAASRLDEATKVALSEIAPDLESSTLELRARADQLEDCAELLHMYIRQTQDSA